MRILMPHAGAKLKARSRRFVRVSCPWIYRESTWQMKFRSCAKNMSTSENCSICSKCSWSFFTDGKVSPLRSNSRSRTMTDGSKPPFPPFTLETASRKVRLAEDAWNTRDPERVSLAYTPDSTWRNRSEFIVGREQIVAFLKRKWSKELEYRLIKELWIADGNRIAVRFAYEWHDDAGSWFRSYGNENWEFTESGLMQRRIASINDLPIKESDRKYRWPLGRRPDDHPGLSDLGL